jgi:hypothetical protein
MFCSMTETAAPLAQAARAQLRFDRLVGLHAQAARLGLLIRQETAALVMEDTSFASRKFVADELSMALAESPGTCGRWVEDAQLTVAHPRVMALVGASVEASVGPAEGRPERTGGLFTMRHADAVLDELAGADDAVQEQVLDLVLADGAAPTPHQLRKATRAARLLHDLQADGDKQDRIDPPDTEQIDPIEQPPSWADRDWLQVREDTEGVLDVLDALARAANGCALREATRSHWAPSVQARELYEQRIRRQATVSRWSTPGLRAAVTTVRTSPPTPIPTASKGYPFRGRLARWIKTRDITCVFPGCTLPAQRCQLDHLTEYPKGKTEHCNGACECTHHHQCKHACMTVARQDDGTIRWTNRFGTTVDRRPRPLLRGW